MTSRSKRQAVDVDPVPSGPLREDLCPRCGATDVQLKLYAMELSCCRVCQQVWCAKSGEIWGREKKRSRK